MSWGERCRGERDVVGERRRKKKRCGREERRRKGKRRGREQRRVDESEAVMVIGSEFLVFLY